MSEERELREDGEGKEEIPENANTEKISMERLLKVFQGGKEVQDANRFASHLQMENAYTEVGQSLSLKGRPVHKKSYPQVLA